MEWPEILRDYESHLEKVSAAIDGKGPWPGEYQQPQPSSVMPRYLEPRAQALVHKTAELATTVKERMGICQSVLAQSKAREPSGRVVLLDIRA